MFTSMYSRILHILILRASKFIFVKYMLILL